MLSATDMGLTQPSNATRRVGRAELVAVIVELHRANFKGRTQCPATNGRDEMEDVLVRLTELKEVQLSLL